MENTMRLIAKWTSALVLFLTLLATASAAEVLRAKPEDVGLSTQRLQRIHELVQRHLDAKSFSGAVTLVARNGRIAHLEAQGLMDIETNKPMATNAMFRIMSMTKPVVGVAVMMLLEEGKIRLNDPVSKFIPQFKYLKVAVPQAGPGGQKGAAAAAEVRF